MLINVILTLIVVGVLLWLANMIPMQSTIKTIMNFVVVAAVVIWLLGVFGVLGAVDTIRVPRYR